MKGSSSLIEEHNIRGKKEQRAELREGRSSSASVGKVGTKKKDVSWASSLSYSLERPEGSTALLALARNLVALQQGKVQSSCLES